MGTESLHVWFEHYINDAGWWNKVENGDDPDEMPPWTGAQASTDTSAS